MRVNPFSDTLSFLTAGGSTTIVFWLLLLGSTGIAVFTYRLDPDQRSARHIWNWLSRLLIGALWWQQSLWKLPPTYTDRPDGSGGLRYWMEQMAQYASLAPQAEFVKKIVLPHFYFFAPQVYAGEVAVAVSLMLGLFTKLGGALGALMAINLWFGLYRAPQEWPWTYFFLVVIQIMFVAYGPGRSLGLDALLRHKESTAAGRQGLARVAKLVGWCRATVDCCIRNRAGKTRLSWPRETGQRTLQLRPAATPDYGTSTPAFGGFGTQSVLCTGRRVEGVRG